jgi:hypothetical protein
MPKCSVVSSKIAIRGVPIACFRSQYISLETASDGFDSSQFLAASLITRASKLDFFFNGTRSAAFRSLQIPVGWNL